MFKVLSRALNNRLKTVRDFIFSRAQKGFTNSRHIQEVLINVLEVIGYCKNNNIPACIVSIDQAKAFDTISNAYMVQAYKFFGFGQNMIKMLNVLGSQRTACILFDGGTLSRPFPLQRGRTQGNGPSPCEYNIGQQILLFKLEFCSELQGVFNHMLVPRPMPGRTYLQDSLKIAEAISTIENDPHFLNESCGQSSTAEGFADDTTATLLFNLTNLKNLKKILTSFSVFSGLKCNLEKTMIMQIGSLIPVSNEILNLGFNHVENIKILGMEIDQKIEKIRQKLRKCGCTD
jgi:hypothetical protein